MHFKKLIKIFKKWIYYVLHKIPLSNSIITFLHNKTNKGFIITLHRVLSAKEKHSQFNSFIEISASKLEEIVINLKKLDVKFVTLKELDDSINKRIKFSYPVTHLSFDDGYYDNYSIAFEILKKHNIYFSIFITSDFIDNERPFLWWYMVEYIAKNEIPVCFEKYNFSITRENYKANTGIKIFELLRNFILNHVGTDNDYLQEKLFGLCDKNILPNMLSWKQINEMVSSGLCELGVHTKNHARFADLTREEKIGEIKYCKKAIRANTGVDAKYFAYPFGSKTDIGNTDDLKEIMATSGIELAFTTIPEELNNLSSKVLVPRLFLNDNANMYTLKSRLNGSYQRGLKS